MTADKKKVLVDHNAFDWDEISGATLRDAGDYLLKLAETLPVDAYIDEHWTAHEDMEIRVLYYRDETDDEYAVRKEWEAEKARRDEEQRKRDEKWVEKRAEYHRLKRELDL